MKYVIIGNSAAGIAAAEEIRARDKEGEVVILSDEKYPVYGRPLISYYLLGATDRERMNYRSPDFYEKNNFSVPPRYPRGKDRRAGKGSFAFGRGEDKVR